MNPSSLTAPNTREASSASDSEDEHDRPVSAGGDSKQFQMVLNPFGNDVPKNRKSADQANPFGDNSVDDSSAPNPFGGPNSTKSRRHRRSMSAVTATSTPLHNPFESNPAPRMRVSLKGDPHSRGQSGGHSGHVRHSSADLDLILDNSYSKSKLSRRSSTGLLDSMTTGNPFDDSTRIRSDGSPMSSTPDTRANPFGDAMPPQTEINPFEPSPPNSRPLSRAISNPFGDACDDKANPFADDLTGSISRSMTSPVDGVEIPDVNNPFMEETVMPKQDIDGVSLSPMQSVPEANPFADGSATVEANPFVNEAEIARPDAASGGSPTRRLSGPNPFLETAALSASDPVGDKDPGDPVPEMSSGDVSVANPFSSDGAAKPRGSSGVADASISDTPNPFANPPENHPVAMPNPFA